MYNIEIIESLKERESKNIYGISREHSAFFLAECFFPVLVVLPNKSTLNTLKESLTAVGKDVLVLDELTMTFYKDVHSSGDLYYQRASFISHLLSKDNYIYLITIENLMQSIPLRKEFIKYNFKVDYSTQIDTRELARKLVLNGYEETFQVQKPHDFSIRGSIIDIFPPKNVYPIRLELFADEIDSMRLFDPLSQLSIENIESFEITKSNEAYLLPQDIEEIEKLGYNYSQIIENESRFYPLIKETTSLLDYIDIPLVVFDLKQIENQAKQIDEDYLIMLNDAIEKGSAIDQEDRRWIKSEIIVRELKKSFTLNIEHDISDNLNYSSRKAHFYEGKWNDFFVDINQLIRRGYSINLYFSKEKKEAFIEEANQRNFSLRNISFLEGPLYAGFIDDKKFIANFSEKNLFNRVPKKKTRHKKLENTKAISSIEDLKKGEYVVHVDYGIGLYNGVVRKEYDLVMRDFVSITYKDGDELFVPTQNIGLIHRYVGSRPQLTKLGNSSWQQKKSKAKKHLEDISDELIDLYSKRLNTKGFAFSKDAAWQKEFEDDFPYQETDDQLRVIEEIKTDMQRQYPMDRVLCGDVGVGKTEVAMRAMFKAVLDGKQVAFLVPTTILCMQHEKTLRDRFKGYPVKIASYSRLIKGNKAKEVREGLKLGNIDIVVGTHKLLSKEIEFSDLGLFVIDEEQRFGVKQKEAIRSKKVNVDTLSLSATPIPRTLQMSISGIRDMSLILEVPKDRFPIQTYLMPFEIEKVKYAIEKEVSRGGQVYYVYNRVGGIENITDMLSRALPEVSFTYCHGQMSEKDIENRISEFIEKKFDVLISTTIIETGMDLENVNTIIMHNATQLGLSQLYQLRGRVGRSNQLAYCYLFYPSETIVTQEALNRLETIREYTDFGSGYKIALRDLELRGAGSIIGAEQSGHFEQIGYELYMQLLTDTIKEKRNVESPVRKAVKIDIPISAFIREDYINNESVRVHYYHRLSNIESYEELIEIENELIDRFGTLPLEVSNLIELSHLRYLLIKSPFNEIKYRGQKIVLKIDDIERIDNFIELAQGKYKNVLRFKNTVEPSVHFMIEDNRVDKAVEMTIELLEDYFKV